MREPLAASKPGFRLRSIQATTYYDLLYVLEMIKKKPLEGIEMIMSNSTFSYDASRKRPGRLCSEQEVMMPMTLGTTMSESRLPVTDTITVR